MLELAFEGVFDFDDFDFEDFAFEADFDFAFEADFVFDFGFDAALVFELAFFGLAFLAALAAPVEFGLELALAPFSLERLFGLLPLDRVLPPLLVFVVAIVVSLP